MRLDEQARRLFRDLSPFDLPIGVYLVAADGRFLECDARVREILHLPSQGPLRASITDFYHDPRERERLVQKTLQADALGRSLEDALITFQVEGQTVFVRDYCRPLRDPQTNELAGFVGCLADVTAEERYHRLFEKLPAGVYQVDADGIIVRVNAATVRMFGYDSTAELEGRPVRELYVNPEDADALREEVQKKGFVTNRIEELVNKEGETLFISVSAFQITGPDGSYAGREGTLVDVTQEERYRRSLNDVPVGFYEVRPKNGVDAISQCNEQFARMFGYEDPEQVIGTDIIKLYADPADYRKFVDRLEQNDRRGEPLLGFSLRVKSRQGQEFVIEVNSRLLRDRYGNVIGRTGVVRDITGEVQLRQRYDRLLSDVGRVLHPFSSMLLLVQHSIAPVGKALGSDPFDGLDHAPAVEEMDTALIAPAARLGKSLEKLIGLSNSEHGAKALPASSWAELSRLLKLFQEYRKRIPDREFRSPALRDASRKVLEICDAIQKGTLAREPVRQVRRNAQALERVTCHIDLHLARTAILQMDQQVHTLRDFVTAGARQEEPREVYRLSDLVSQAVQRLNEFAKNQGVEIRQQDESAGAQVRVSEREVVRALTNLLHNAIKYSWHPSPHRARWCLVRLRVVGQEAQVIFENYGVPITKEEIEQELLFQVGYRGQMSRDRGRMGTGIGLTDARSVARNHGGDVTIRSRPASADREETDYTAPFITTATLSLPVYGKERRR